jgi:hypothetical protein
MRVNRFIALFFISSIRVEPLIASVGGGGGWGRPYLIGGWFSYPWFFSNLESTSSMNRNPTSCFSRIVYTDFVIFISYSSTVTANLFCNNLTWNFWNCLKNTSVDCRLLDFNKKNFFKEVIWFFTDRGQWFKLWNLFLDISWNSRVFQIIMAFRQWEKITKSCKPV